MSGLARVNDLLKVVQDAGLIRYPRQVEDAKSTGLVTVEGEVNVEGHEVTIGVTLDRTFPLSLPRIYLRPWDSLGYIPHVDTSGNICFSDPEGLLLDRREPVGIVLSAIQRAVQVLTDGVSRRNRKDFVEEFEAHWRRLQGALSAISVLEPIDDLGHIIVARDQKTGVLYVSEAEQDIHCLHNKTGASGRLTIENGLYIPLQVGTLIIPPRPDKPFWTPEEIRQTILPNIDPAHLKNLRRLLRKRCRRVKYIIFKLPRFSGGASLFGLKYERISTQHPLLNEGSDGGVLPLALERLDRTYLVQRGGGNDALCEKQVLLIGCGAVGGHLVFDLARAGISYFTLVDPDVLKPENTYRHVLGKKYWTKPKTQALKQELETQLPYISVKSYNASIEQLLTDKIIDLARYDLIVLATGNPTVELHINELIHREQNGPMALFTWLEPLGIGGHALLSNNKFSGGCLECLYTAVVDNDSGMENRAAFAAPRQFFGRALSGCGSLHTPYGSMDAAYTATIAAKLAVNALIGNELGNPLLSWKGEATKFVEQGFRLSNRYLISEVELYRNRYLYHTARCRVCGSEAS